MVTQQRKPTPEDFYNQDHPQEQERPYQEKLPKAFERQPEPSRFEEVQPEYFWIYTFWGIMSIILLLGVASLFDMYHKSAYNWLLALSWTSTAVCGAGGLALIQKNWLRK